MALVKQEQSTNEMTDDSSPTASLRGGYVSNEEDPRTMIAQFEKADTTTSALKEDDDDIESMLQQLERLKATHSHFSNDDSKGTAPRLGKQRNFGNIQDLIG